MKRNGAKLLISLEILLVSLAISVAANAQISTATLSGTVTDLSGKAVPEAKVSAKNVATGQSSVTQSGATGAYSFADLPPGQYEVSIAAPGFTSETSHVSLASGAKQSLNLKLAPELSLSSLGFSKAQTEGSAKEQALLNKRSHMLQVHQKLGLITAIPLTATVIAGAFAGGRHSDPTHRDIHIALGSATVGLYAATAYYAIFAPKVPGVKHHGPTRFHEAMAWIHGPGMILTPIAGAMAESQLNSGERTHGLAKYHGEIAVITAAAYGLALLSETKPSWIGLGGHAAAAIFPFHHHRTENASAPPKSTEDTRTADKGQQTDVKTESYATR